MSSKAGLIRWYDSIHELANQADKSPKDKTCASVSNGKEYGDDWHGTKTLEESIRYAKYGGWEPEVATEFRDMFDQFMPKLRGFIENAFEPGVDHAGYEVNMQAYLDGEPENMFQFLPSEHQVTKRALCLLLGHSISGGCSSRELFIRGQAAVALVRALSLLGYELEIWSEETVSGSGGGTLSTLCRLHGAGEVMDESAVEFAVGNPSWLRRLIFACQETEFWVVRKQFGFGVTGTIEEYRGGYGSCVSPQHAETVNADIVLDLGRTWFSEGWGDTDKMAAAGFDWVVQQLKDAGVLDKDAEVEM